ncbi:MAG: MarR family winged helix-turn-helix transcriptional regulator, partial [Thermonemataceae bacterium]
KDAEEGTPATKNEPLNEIAARSKTRTKTRMEEIGLIYREQDLHDKRSVRIHLTEKGKEKKEVARKVVRSFNFSVREIIPEEQLKVFFEVVRKVTRLVEEMR